MMFTLVEENEELANIKVIGVGGAGGNAVNRMIEAGLSGVDFYAVNTDMQALRESRAHALQIGCQLTRGLGSGGDPRVGRKAIEEDQTAIVDLLDGSDMVFLTAGMGGGTGTGAAPVLARLARELGILTVGIVTKPFQFEGSVRTRQAEEGVIALREAVDTLIIIPNQRLLEVVPPRTSFQEAFRIADNILYEATRGIYEIIARPNHVNLDFADVRTVMKGMGVALMGTGRAEGEERAANAARGAISSPLLEDVNIHGARGVLVNILGSEVGISEISEAMSLIQDAAGAQAHIIFGYGTDDSLGDTLQVTVIATGFKTGSQPQTALAGSDLLPYGRQDGAGLPGPVESDSGDDAVGRPPSWEEDHQGTRVISRVASRQDGAAVDREAAPQVAREAAPPLRQAAAMAGGSEPVVQDANTTTSRFLRPVAGTNILSRPGRRPEMNVDSGQQVQGFQSDALVEDLSVPTYTRKYMD